MAITAHPIANWQRRAAPRSEQRALWLRKGPCESITGSSEGGGLLRGDGQQMKTSGWPDAAHFESQHHVGSLFNPITWDGVYTLSIPDEDGPGYQAVLPGLAPSFCSVRQPDLSFNPHAAATTLTHRSQMSQLCCFVAPSEFFSTTQVGSAPGCLSSFSPTHPCSSEPPQITFLSSVVGVS